MYVQHKYAVSTLQLFRSAITHLNHRPAVLRDSDQVNAFFTVLLSQAPPIRLHRPTISLAPTFNHFLQVVATSMSLARLQQKLAFLLGITCFLRPSDLHRIPYSSATLSGDDGSSLFFEVHCPKEKRGRRRIIKSFSVKAHNDHRLCPIRTFTLLQSRRPYTGSVSTLFINSVRPQNELSIRTVQAWISKLIKLSTSEKRVSLRSIGSSIALQAGIPKEQIVTMGNWQSSTTFENHYRREHLSNFDFTNAVISPEDIDILPDNLQEEEENEDDDIFL